MEVITLIIESISLEIIGQAFTAGLAISAAMLAFFIPILTTMFIVETIGNYLEKSDSK